MVHSPDIPAKFENAAPEVAGVHRGVKCKIALTLGAKQQILVRKVFLC